MTSTDMSHANVEYRIQNPEDRSQNPEDRIGETDSETFDDATSRSCIFLNLLFLLNPGLYGSPAPVYYVVPGCYLNVSNSLFIIDILFD